MYHTLKSAFSAGASVYCCILMRHPCQMCMDRVISEFIINKIEIYFHHLLHHLQSLNYTLVAFFVRTVVIYFVFKYLCYG